ncbi:recombinase family protein [Leptolyngbya sp. FACHB-261]|nr:recombinase family protein [Leptolyngbya sp. FACHB-261]
MVVAYLYSEPGLEPAPELFSENRPSEKWPLKNWPLEDWSIDRVYQDLGGRQQLQALLTDAQAGQFSHLLLPRLADLGDTVEEVCQRLQQLEAQGICLIATHQSYRSDAGTSNVAAQLDLLREIEANQQQRRLRLGHARKRLQALPPPGKAPYGYRRGKEHYIIDRSAAVVVKDFFEQFLLYGSLRGAVRYLAKKHGKRISVATGRRWLTSAVYRGDLSHPAPTPAGKPQVLRDTHPALLSRQDAAQVDRLLRRNASLPRRTVSAPRSLAGLVSCAECAQPLTISRVTTHGKSREYLYLRNPKCSRAPKCPAIAYQQVLEQVIEAICTDLPRTVSGLDFSRLGQARAGMMAVIADKERILEQIPSLEATGVLDSETATLRTYNLRTELADLQTQMAQLPPISLSAIAQTASLPQFWQDLSETERRFFFREFIRQIGVRQSPDGVTVELKFVF